MPEIRTGHCPLHAPSWQKAIGDYAEGQGWDCFAFSEGYRAWPWCKSVSGQKYKYFTVQGTRTDSRGREVGHDVIYAIRSNYVMEDHGGFKIADEMHVGAKGNTYYPERWAKWVLFRRPDGLRILDVRWHPQPGAMKNKRVRASYRNSVKIVQEQIRKLSAKYKPDLVLGGGDLQVGRVNLWLSPVRMYKRLGMTANNVRIDYLAWGNRWKKTGGRTLPVRKRFKGLDHPWMGRTVER